MKKNIFENLFIVIGSIIFYLLFWQEKMGLNILIFDTLMVSGLFILKPEIRNHRPVIITVLGTLITAFLVVWNNSLMSKIVHLISFTTLVGFTKQKELRFLGYSLMLAIISFCESPVKIIQQFLNVRENNPLRLAPVFRSFRISLLPLLVLVLFYVIYLFSNPEFRSFSNQFWNSFFEWFSWNISIPQIAFFLFGVLIISNIILKSDFPIFKNLQKSNREHLERVKKNYPVFFKGMIALKSEFQSGLILLISLNLLLIVVNVLDIKNYWIGTSYQLPPYEMKQMVHQGTYLLITALILAMIVISFLFRKNLNFYPKNKKLKTLGYFWIVQNGILAISLFIKNLRYIEANDLAYKRIGVLIFLFLVFAGLITMILKIKNKKTFYFLLHKNSWIAYCVFILCSFVNWDIIITKYNLSTQIKSKIDYRFLVSNVSDKNIYLLLEQKKQDLLPENQQKWINRALADKKNRFLKKQKNKTWLSWNFPDQMNLDFLKDID